MTGRADIVEAKLANGALIHIEATNLGGETDVVRTIPSFEGVTDAVAGIAASLKETLQQVQFRRASLEFGLEVGIESGQLTALLVKGTGTANLKITVEWGGQSDG